MTDDDTLSRALPTLGLTGVPVFPRVRGSRQRLAWLRRRADGLGSSDIAAVLLLSTYQSPFSLWWTKRDGWVDEDQQTEEQYWGLRSEEMVAQRFAEDHRELRVVKPPAALYAHPRHWWALCSPDRFVVDKSTGLVLPLELKTDMNYQRWTEHTPPDVYRVQLAWQCLVLGVRRGWLAAKVGTRTYHYLIEFGEGELGGLLVAGEWFWASVMADDVPDLDGHQATTAALRRLHHLDEDAAPVLVPDALRDEYFAAWRANKAARAALDECENRMRAALGNAKRAIGSDGKPVAVRSVYERQGFVVKPTTIDKLEARPPKEKST